MSQGIWSNYRTPHSSSVSYKDCILQQLELGCQAVLLNYFLGILVLFKGQYNTANGSDLCLKMCFGQIKKLCNGQLCKIFCSAPDQKRKLSATFHFHSVLLKCSPLMFLKVSESLNELGFFAFKNNIFFNGSFVLITSDIVNRPQMSNPNNRVQSKQHEVCIICTGCDQT